MASELDNEIERLKARVAALKHDLKIQTSTILSNHSTATYLSSATTTAAHKQQQQKRSKLLAARARDHAAHNQRGLYRACAGVTTFRVRDPDPRAVDGGNVLGLRVEVARRGRFVRPYYVLLNRPYGSGGSGGAFLSVHRHTVPPCVPLSALAARYLPPPRRLRGGEEAGDEARGAGDGERGRDGAAEDRGPTQDLSRFVRTLRREIVRYHNRIGGVADLRRAAGLDGKSEKKKKRGGSGEGADGTGDEAKTDAIVDITPADPAAKQIKIEWRDGRTGRLVLDDDGQVTKVIVFGEGGRDRSRSRALLRQGLHLDDVVRILADERKH